MNPLTQIVWRKRRMAVTRLFWKYVLHSEGCAGCAMMVSKGCNAVNAANGYGGIEALN